MKNAAVLEDLSKTAAFLFFLIHCREMYES